MKKILLVLAVVALGISSCKKETEIKPVQVENAAMGAGTLKDMSGMD